MAYRLFVILALDRSDGGPRGVLGGIGMTGKASMWAIFGSATVRVFDSGETMIFVVGGVIDRLVVGVVTASDVVDGKTASVLVGGATARVVVSGMGCFCVDLLFIQTCSRWYLVIATEGRGYFRTSDAVLSGIDIRNLAYNA